MNVAALKEHADDHDPETCPQCQALSQRRSTEVSMREALAYHTELIKGLPFSDEVKNMLMLGLHLRETLGTALKDAAAYAQEKDLLERALQLSLQLQPMDLFINDLQLCTLRMMFDEEQVPNTLREENLCKLSIAMGPLGVRLEDYESVSFHTALKAGRVGETLLYKPPVTPN